MRQDITARRLANSPPAPSPSKKPKRAAPQLTPKELAKLAKKQLVTLRRLLDGSGRPYPGPCGVERPVDEIIKFVKKAHSAWMASVSFWTHACISVLRYPPSLPPLRPPAFWAPVVFVLSSPRCRRKCSIDYFFCLCHVLSSFMHPGSQASVPSLVSPPPALSA